MPSAKVEPFFKKHISKKTDSTDSTIDLKSLKKVVIILFSVALFIGIIILILFAAGKLKNYI